VSVSPTGNVWRGIPNQSAGHEELDVAANCVVAGMPNTARIGLVRFARFVTHLARTGRAG